MLLKSSASPAISSCPSTGTSESSRPPAIWAVPARTRSMRPASGLAHSRLKPTERAAAKISMVSKSDRSWTEMNMARAPASSIPRSSKLPTRPAPTSCARTPPRLPSTLGRISSSVRSPLPPPAQRAATPRPAGLAPARRAGPSRPRRSPPERRRETGVPGPGSGPPISSGELVADAPNGLQVTRMGRIGLYLLAQAPDVDRHRAGLGGEGVIPDGLHKLVAGVDAARTPGQVVEEVELPGGERHGFASDGDLAGARVYPQPVECEDLLAGVGLVHAAQHGRHPRRELAGREGLDHVVVGAQAEADDPVFLFAPGGQHDQGHPPVGS